MRTFRLGPIPRLLTGRRAWWNRGCAAIRVSSIALLLALGAVVRAQELSAAGEDAGLVVVGVVGPQNITLTEAHPSAAKPVVVFLENRSAQPKIIPDANALDALVALRIQPLGGATTLPPVLVPPPKFPITLRPAQKLSVVFEVTFDRAESPVDVIGFRYTAALNQTAPGVATAMNPSIDHSMSATVSAATDSSPANPSNARARTIKRGSDRGATVTASPMHVALKKGKSESDPITFSAKWSKSHFVSGWSETPSDSTADADLKAAKNSHTAKVHWTDPGEYTVGVYLFHADGGFGFFAHPTVVIDVIKVEFKDEMGNDPDGMKVGVTTGTADRSRTITATVEPASQTSNVTVKVSKGSDKLSVKNINPGNGTITFQVEGIGMEGSKAEKDCTFEAEVDGKPAATADVTVVVPKKLTQSKGTFYTKNIQANSGTTPAQPKTPGPLLATLETFYGFPVTVTVMDRFGNPIVDPNNPHLYLAAPVFEAFIVKGATYKPAPINLKISASSDYVDPVGFQVWEKSFFGAPPPWGFYNPGFSAGSTPRFGIPNFPPHSKTNPPPQPTVFNVVVDGFTVEPTISRTLDIVGTTVTLTQTP